MTPSPNFFRFNMDGSQWLVGLGNYIYNDKKWRKIATVAEDYSFPYTQLFGFMPEYCSLGGQIVEKFWVPLGTKDFASIIAKLPDDVDAIYLGLGGGDAVNFFNQYAQAGGKAKLIGGSILVDQTVLSSKGAAKRIAIGIPSAGPQADVWDNAKWNAWVKLYQASFPADKRFTSPSLTGTAYYNDFNAVFHGAQQDQRRSLGRPQEVPRGASRSSSSTRRTARSSSTRTARRSAPTSSPKWSNCRTAIWSTRP